MSTTIRDFNTTVTNSFLSTYAMDNLLFFDIETTGFSANTSEVYLIGCTYKFRGHWKIVQFFLDGETKESDLIYDFMSFATSYNMLVTYNGTGFDMRYLKDKCTLYGIDYTLGYKKHFDIYKAIAPYKKFFRLEHLKQRNIEAYLEIDRKDEFSGGELIYTYQNYKTNPSTALKETLLLHNHDDLTGMLQILPIVNYVDFFTGHYNITSMNIEKYKDRKGNEGLEAIFKIQLFSPIKNRISYGNDLFYFSACDTSAFVRTRIFNEEMKFFYSDYKDYYYLPNEDKAVHKSVSFFVDKDFRTQAKAANCYSKKTGRFLAQFEEIVSPYFKKEYDDKVMFFELDNEFIENKNLVHRYTVHIIDHFLHCRKNK